MINYLIFSMQIYKKYFTNILYKYNNKLKKIIKNNYRRWTVRRKIRYGPYCVIINKLNGFFFVNTIFPHKRLNHLLIRIAHISTV